MAFGYAAAFYLAILFATPAEGKWDFKFAGRATQSVCGRVSAVTKTAITITLLRDGNNLKTNAVLTLPFHHRLACGSLNLLESESYIYRRDDVKVGDCVDLRLVLDKIQYCASINIWERPGGKLPPTFLSRPTDWQANYEMLNALNAFERDKVPMPSHLTLTALPQHYPAFDPQVPKKDRLKRFPYDRPFTPSSSLSSCADPSRELSIGGVRLAHVCAGGRLTRSSPLTSSAWRGGLSASPPAPPSPARP
jgi:hypothetical protein